MPQMWSASSQDTHAHSGVSLSQIQIPRQPKFAGGTTTSAATRDTKQNFLNVAPRPSPAAVDTSGNGGIARRTTLRIRRDGSEILVTAGHAPREVRPIQHKQVFW